MTGKRRKADHPDGPAAMKTKLEEDAARWVRLAQELDIKPLD